MATWVNLMDLIFPIGSFYISRQSTSPANIIGGSWAQVTDAVLRGSTGIGYVGSDTHTLTVNEMPSHAHELDMYLHNNNGSSWEYHRSIWSNLCGSRFVTMATGGGQAHSIVQRSYNCYIWYRTA